MAIPQCRECENKNRKSSITNNRIYYKCNNNKRTICYGDKLPKTSPMWCPKRQALADLEKEGED